MSDPITKNGSSIERLPVPKVVQQLESEITKARERLDPNEYGRLAQLKQLEDGIHMQRELDAFQKMAIDVRRDLQNLRRRFYAQFGALIGQETPPQIEILRTESRSGSLPKTAEPLPTMTPPPVASATPSPPPTIAVGPSPAQPIAIRDLRPNPDFDWKGRPLVLMPQAYLPEERRHFGSGALGFSRQLTPYQRELIERARQMVLSGQDRGLIVLPPRTGKTLSAVALALVLSEQFLDIFGKKKIVFVGHTRRIVRQNFEELSKLFFAYNVGLVMGEEQEWNKHYLSMSIQSWLNNRDRLTPDEVGILVLDEAHHYTYGNENLDLLIRMGFMDASTGGPLYRPGRLLLGLTATPDRLSNAPLNMIYGPEGLWFQRDITYFFNLRDSLGRPYVLEPRIIPVPLTGVSYDGLEIDPETGDYRPEDILKQISSEDLGAHMASLIKDQLTDKKGRIQKTFVTVKGIEDVRTVAAVLRKTGIPAIPLHSALSTNEISDLLDELSKMGISLAALGPHPPLETETLEEIYQKNLVTVLVTDRMWMEGANDPDIEVVILGRGTASRSNYIQWIFRGATVAPFNPHKKEAVVYDYGGNHARFPLQRSETAEYALATPDNYAEESSPGARPGYTPLQIQTVRPYRIQLDPAIKAPNLHGNPFQEAFRHLVPDEATVVMTAYRLGLPADLLFHYFYGNTVPMKTGDIMSLALVLKDEEGRLMDGWAKTQTALMEQAYPTPDGEQLIQEFVTMGAVPKGREHHLVEVICRYLKDSKWVSTESLLDDLESLSGYSRKDLEKRMKPAPPRVVRPQEIRRMRLFHISKEGTPESLKLTLSKARHPITGERTFLYIWRRLKKGGQLAFVSDPSLEIFRILGKPAPGHRGRSALNLLYDPARGLWMSVVSEGGKATLRVVKNPEILGRALRALQTLKDLPEKTQAFIHIFRAATRSDPVGLKEIIPDGQSFRYGQLFRLNPIRLARLELPPYLGEIGAHPSMSQSERVLRIAGFGGSGAYAREIKTWQILYTFCLSQIGNPFFPYEEADIQSAFETLMHFLGVDSLNTLIAQGTLSEFFFRSDPSFTVETIRRSELVQRVLTTLTPKEERVMTLRFGLKGEEESTSKEIGQIFGVWRQRIHQIKANALRKLKHPFRGKRLAEFKELPPLDWVRRNSASITAFSPLGRRKLDADLTPLISEGSKPRPRSKSKQESSPTPTTISTDSGSLIDLDPEDPNKPKNTLASWIGDQPERVGNTLIVPKARYQLYRTTIVRGATPIQKPTPNTLSPFRHQPFSQRIRPVNTLWSHPLARSRGPAWMARR